MRKKNLELVRALLEVNGIKPDKKNPYIPYMKAKRIYRRLKHVYDLNKMSYEEFIRCVCNVLEI